VSTSMSSLSMSSSSDDTTAGRARARAEGAAGFLRAGLIHSLRARLERGISECIGELSGRTLTLLPLSGSGGGVAGFSLLFILVGDGGGGVMVSVSSGGS
jgi:hypothetical protein